VQQPSPRLGCPASSCQSVRYRPRAVRPPDTLEGRHVTVRAPDSLQTGVDGAVVDIHLHPNTSPHLKRVLHHVKFSTPRRAPAASPPSWRCRGNRLQAPVLSEPSSPKQGVWLTGIRHAPCGRGGSLSDGTPMDCCPACMFRCKTPTF
jgi:hypothetical protein